MSADDVMDAYPEPYQDDDETANDPVDDSDTCPDCGCDLESEYHDWDCAYADDDNEEDE